jgi:ligand-binding sensor domain-containing protein
VTTGAVGALPADRALTQYVHREWQVRDGLPQNTVQALAQTPDGYLWVGTEESLVRFDGHRFVAFAPEDHPGLGHNYVETLLTSRDGSLWIGTHKGLARMSEGRFTSFSTRDGLAGDVVRGLAEDGSGTLWVATSSGLTRFRDGRFASWTSRDGLPTDNLTELLPDGQGGVWLGTETAGVVHFAEGRVTTHPGCRGPASNQVASLLRTADGTLWVGTEGGLCRMDGTGLRPAAVPGLQEAGLQEAGPVRALHEDGEGALWIGTRDGVFRRSARGVEAYGARDGLSNDLVTTFFDDREGNLWIGTDGGGLNQLRAASFVTLSVPEGLPSPFVHGILESRDGSLWIATRDGGLARFRHGRRTVFTTRDGLASDDVRSLAEARDGSLWIGTSAGLTRYRGGRFDTYTTRDGLPHDAVRVLLTDSRGDLWVGTDDGAARLRDGVFTRYGTADGMPAPRVWVIAETRDGSLWFGGMATRLARLRDGAFTAYGEEHGLPGPALALHEDRHGTLWVGTGHSGLARFRDGKFRVLTKADGLYDNLVVSIVEDRRERFWMTTNRGVFRASRAELDAAADRRGRVRSRVFHNADGLRSVECNGTILPSSLRTRAGRLWFPTIDGAVSVDPERLVANPVPPRPLLDRMRVDGREVPLGPGLHGGELRLPAQVGDIEIGYTAPSFRVPEKVAFRYRLEGFDAGWVDAGTRRTAYYTHVPSGSYTFRVMARNEDGVWSEDPVSLGFSLAPRYYETGWFRLAVALATGLGLFGIHRARIGRLRARERELARRVDEALARVKVLSGLLPICASCKNVRDDKGYWNQIESYVTEHSEAEFTHGICPDCASRLYPEYWPEISGTG